MTTSIDHQSCPKPKLSLPLIVCACAGVLAAISTTSALGAVPGRSDKRATAVNKAPCTSYLAFDRRLYRLVRLRPGTVVLGARIAGRPALRCERDLRCRGDGTCRVAAGRVVRTLRVRRLRGVKAFLAVADARSGGVYVNRAVFPALIPAKQLIRMLKRGGVPVQDPSSEPPQSDVLASDEVGGLPLGLGEYCWSTPSGQGWVQGCALPPPLPDRYDLPLIIANPSATIRVRLGVQEPNVVRVTLLDSDRAYYSESLKASQALTWVVPRGARARSFLQIEVGRVLPGAAQDFVEYLARLQVTGRLATG